MCTFTLAFSLLHHLLGTISLFTFERNGVPKQCSSMCCLSNHLYVAESLLHQPACDILSVCGTHVFLQLYAFCRYCFLGDGCMMEGICQEACSLAGHWGLGKLICIYDDNSISIDGETSVTFTEDTTKRFEALNWHVVEVKDGNHDMDAIRCGGPFWNVTRQPHAMLLRGHQTIYYQSSCW